MTVARIIVVQVELKDNNDKSIFGCGIHTSITLAPILAVISAINKIN